ncbi:hypothetical protein GDO81_026172 [Engystomops pustulosus]|uniref:Uncharacterized protein n=1 Tax=Engystomops pustulosus TaxID=76066 RepID=A0AAV6ZL04_ENGPU|nr:hypothetical protein GDO81_026172 [Engystomops pustulosus]
MLISVLAHTFLRCEMHQVRFGILSRRWKRAACCCREQGAFSPAEVALIPGGAPATVTSTDKRRGQILPVPSYTTNPPKEE